MPGSEAKKETREATAKESNFILTPLILKPQTAFTVSIQHCPIRSMATPTRVSTDVSLAFRTC